MCFWSKASSHCPSSSRPSSSLRAIQGSIAGVVQAVVACRTGDSVPLPHCYHERIPSCICTIYVDQCNSTASQFPLLLSRFLLTKCADWNIVWPIGHPHMANLPTIKSCFCIISQLKTRNPGTELLNFVARFCSVLAISAVQRQVIVPAMSFCSCTSMILFHKQMNPFCLSRKKGQRN